MRSRHGGERNGDRSALSNARRARQNVISDNALKPLAALLDARDHGAPLLRRSARLRRM
jgi:hypothetical protein